MINTDFKAATDYELCALYCDYHEWLNRPRPPHKEETRAKYEQYMREILGELADRHYQPR